jgi:hypothetical protein
METKMKERKKVTKTKKKLRHRQATKNITIKRVTTTATKQRRRKTRQDIRQKTKKIDKGK